MAYTIDELKHVCLFPSHGGQEYPTTDMDEVYPGIYLGNAASAADIDRLHRHNIGYVLNVAHGTDASLNQVTLSYHVIVKLSLRIISPFLSMLQLLRSENTGIQFKYQSKHP